MAESHAHRHDARTDTTVIRHPIADNGTFGYIHDEPDIGLDPMNFDVGLISDKGIVGIVIVVIYKTLDADGSGFTVVGDLLVGDPDVIQVFLSERPRFTCKVRHRDMTWKSNLRNFRDEAFFGRKFKSILKKSIVNSR